MKTGCLIAGAVSGIALSRIVFLIIAAESNGRAPSIDFSACSSTEKEHITRVYQAVFADREKFYDFTGLARMTARRQAEMKRNLVRVWPLEITCQAANDCPYGVNERGWVVGGDARFTMCGYTQPGNDCDTYAGLAYGNGFTRGLWEGDESAAFFAYARQICLTHEEIPDPPR